jgi:hypothetical protein
MMLGATVYRHSIIERVSIKQKSGKSKKSINYLSFTFEEFVNANLEMEGVKKKRIQMFRCRLKERSEGGEKKKHGF